MRRPLITTLAALVTLSCSDRATAPALDDTTAIVQSASAEAVAGDAQTATVGTPLPSALIVRVLVDGAPRGGVVVEWFTASGSLPRESVTDAWGYARATWTLGGGAGPQRASAAITGSGGQRLATATFTATATPGRIARLELVGAAQGRAPANSAYGFWPYAPTVRPTDAYGNAPIDTVITWSVIEGSLMPAPRTRDHPYTWITNGITSMGFVATGAPGIGRVRASVPGSTASIDFELTVLPAEYVVRITDFYYDGFPLFVSQQNRTGQDLTSMAVDTIPAGMSVRWVNMFHPNQPAQRVVPLDGDAFPPSPPLSRLDEFEVTFTTPGTYRYANATTPGIPAGTIVVR